jgi:hypothetical protein
METLLYRFRYRDPLTGQWIMSGYSAAWDAICMRCAHTEFEVIGEPEANLDEEPVSFEPLRRREMGLRGDRTPTGIYSWPR